MQKPEIKNGVFFKLSSWVGLKLAKFSFKLLRPQARQMEGRYRRNGDYKSLERAVNLLRMILNSPAFAFCELSFQLQMLNDGCRTLLSLYLERGDIADLNSAIVSGKYALNLVIEESPELPSILTNLGNAMKTRFERSGSLEDLEESIRLYERISTAPVTESSNLPLYLSNLGSALIIRFNHTGHTEDLQKGIQIFRRALSLTTIDSHYHALCLGNLAVALNGLFEHNGNSNVLDESILVCRQALSVLEPDAFEHHKYLNILGVGLSNRFRINGDSEDLDEAIQLCQQAVATTPLNSPMLSLHLNNLGLAILLRFKKSGSPEDLDVAISVYNQAIATATDTPNLPTYLNNLSSSLISRYLLNGQLQDLEQGIEIIQQAVRQPQTNSAALLNYQGNLGSYLLLRAIYTGRMEDLEHSISLCRKAVAQTSQEVPQSLLHLTNLGNSLHILYERTQQIDALEQAIAVYSQAVTQSNADSPEHALLLTNLGNSLIIRYELKKDIEDLEQAIVNCQQAVAHRHANKVNKALYLNALGSGLFNRYRCKHAIKDLDQAIMAFQESVIHSGSGTPVRIFCLSNLGTSLRCRYELTGDKDDVEQGITALQQACQQGQNYAPEATLMAAYKWGDWARKREQWPETNEAYTYGLVAVDRLYMMQLTRRGQERVLSLASGFHVHAAYALARDGKLINAATTLEHGRARLLAETLEQTRHDLELLPKRGHFNLYERFCNLIKHQYILRSQLGLLVNPTDDRSLDTKLAETLIKTQADVNDVIREIQQIPGYEDFFAQSTFAQLNIVAKVAPLVYLLTTDAGGLALIVDDREITPVWLEQLTEEALNSQLINTSANDNISAGYLIGQLVDPFSLRDSLSNLLNWTGETILSPLAKVLHQRLSSSQKENSAKPSIILIPCGRLSLLPLHAATYVVDGKTLSFLDEFNVSYAPSARSLNHARNTLVQRQQQSPVLLGVGNPLPVRTEQGQENWHSLPNARKELEEIAQQLKNEIVYAFYEQAATRTAILTHLSAATLLHLSCHGSFDPNDALCSGLQLSDGTLTLRELLDPTLVQLDHLRLAVLSACQTAITDFNNLADESIGLPAGFLQAGAPGVVGSLWPVEDRATALLMRRFYQNFLDKKLEPAAALSEAQCWLRDLTWAELGDYYRSFISRMSASDALKVYNQSVRPQMQQDPAGRPYENPYYWAGFTFTGA